ncbi:hypothetical protein J4Q44_G00175210 [Coregonus suidteri]|uniref:Acyl-CoA dehydrogenase/oxidase N-terminal domain-containing protein n=1 Tax=Coregonus suidteri TaxID=861788 RepID=A0AAN8R3V0_9TELE
MIPLTEPQAKVQFNWRGWPGAGEGQLTEEEIMIRDSFRDYCQDKLMPRILMANRNEVFHRDIVSEMGELGAWAQPLKAMAVLGRAMWPTGLIAREVERVDSGYRSVMSVQSSPSARGEILGCFGLTEPTTTAVTPVEWRTRAQVQPLQPHLHPHRLQDLDHHSPVADIAVVWAKCDDGKVRGFILERGSLWLLLNNARYGIAWGSLEIQFGVPLARNQLMQKKDGRHVDRDHHWPAGLSTAREELIDAKKAAPEMISMLKRNSCGKSLDIARQARDMLGGNGISDEYHIIRHL